MLGTDPAMWKFQVPGFLRSQSLTEWPNCHKGNSKLITTKITEAFCERHCRPEPGEPRAGAYHCQAELRERIRALRGRSAKPARIRTSIRPGRNGVTVVSSSTLSRIPMTK